MQRVRPSENLKELSLLYVEDEESIREPFLMLVERYFKKVYVATNGEEGIELFNKYQTEIDIIISDIRMPKMNGLDMAREIKNIDYEIPLIFITAFGDTDYLRDAIEVGADGYIGKPVDRNQLFTKLNALSHFLMSKKENSEYLKLIETLFNYQTNGLVLLDRDFDIKIYNRTFKLLLDEAGIKITSSMKDIILHCIDDNQKPIDLERFIHANKLVCQHQKDDVLKYFDVDIQRIESYTLLTFTDITEYKLEAKEIQDIAIKDELTGLYNRKKLDLLNIHNNNICLIIFDIDNFKQINDTYGHLKGDEVLKALADTIKQNVRETDILIRWGGEEFLVILEHIKDIEMAKNLAEKLRHKINEIVVSEVGHFSCSFGVSCGFITARNDVERILSKADEALYRAKGNGKNRVEIS